MIKFASWNICRGLHSKEQEICQILDEAQIDVVILQEIDLINYSSQQLKFPNFQTYVYEGEKRRACILVKDGTFTNVAQLQQEHPRTEDANGSKVTLANIYREWGQDQEEIIDQLSEKQSQQGKLLVAGNFKLDPTRLDDPTYGAKALASRFQRRTEQAGLTRVSFGQTFQRSVMDSVVASELDWV